MNNPVKQRMFRWNTRWISVTEYPLSVKEYPRSNAFSPVTDTTKVSTTAIPADDGPRGIYKMAAVKTTTCYPGKILRRMSTCG